MIGAAKMAGTGFKFSFSFLILPFVFLLLFRIVRLLFSQAVHLPKIVYPAGGRTYYNRSPKIGKGAIIDVDLV